MEENDLPEPGGPAGHELFRRNARQAGVDDFLTVDRARLEILNSARQQGKKGGVLRDRLHVQPEEQPPATADPRGDGVLVLQVQIHELRLVEGQKIQAVVADRPPRQSGGRKEGDTVQRFVQAAEGRPFAADADENRLADLHVGVGDG